MAMAGPKAPGKLSYEEFLAWCDEDTWAEWVDGEVVMLSAASSRHQEITSFLSSILSVYAQVHDLGTVLTAPFQMRLAALGRGREDGPADLVIEIISSESRLRDRGEKFAEYEMGGVKEYWLIDPEEQRADFYILGTDGRYARGAPDAQGIY